MEIIIDVGKSTPKNAGFYYEKAKRAKKKIAGAKEAYQLTLKKIEKLERKKEFAEKEEDIKEEKIEKKRWYEKFRWFISSEGVLCIGGRDATTNDLIIKKHLDKDDLVFHTQLSGSPFFVVKAEGKKIGKETINEAAEATASYSKAWKLNITTTEVYYVKPEQVKKEFGLPKGSFMIHGKREYLKPEVRVAVGITKEGIIGGAVNAVKKHAEKYVIVRQGSTEKGKLVKEIKKRIGGKEDDIQGFLPAGEGEIAK